jgi:hypothetical protein
MHHAESREQKHFVFVLKVGPITLRKFLRVVLTSTNVTHQQVQVENVGAMPSAVTLRVDFHARANQDSQETPLLIVMTLMNALIGHLAVEKLNAKMHLGHSDVLAQMDCLSIVQHEPVLVPWYAAIITIVQEMRFVLVELVTVPNLMLDLVVKIHVIPQLVFRMRNASFKTPHQCVDVFQDFNCYPYDELVLTSMNVKHCLVGRVQFVKIL